MKPVIYRESGDSSGGGAGTGSAAPTAGGARGAGPGTKPATPTPPPAGDDASGAGGRQAALEAAERARVRRGLEPKPSPAAGLSTNPDNKLRTRHKVKASGEPSELEKLRAKTTKAGAKPLTTTVEPDASALPGVDPLEVEVTPRTAEELEEILAPAPGETEIPVFDPTNPQAIDPDAVVATPEEYTPNLKYKAFGEERDIPELFHALIKDPESERAVHEVFEKAGAFDKTKQNFTELEGFVKQQIVPEVNNYRALRAEFQGYLDRQNPLAILEKMGVPEKLIIQKVAERIRLNEMPPDQRAVYDARAAQEAELAKAASQNQLMAQRLARLESDAIQTELSVALTRPDIAPIAQAYDARTKSGAFEDLVRMTGDFAWRNGQQITPTQAALNVIQKYGLSAGTAPAPQARPAPAPRPAPQAPAPRVLPNVQSKNISQARTQPVVNSVADIRKLAKDRRARA